MIKSLKEQCKKKEFCFDKIQEAREMFGNKNSTMEDFDKIRKKLLYILIYNEKENIKTLIHSTLHEMDLRESYYAVHVWPFQNKKIQYLQWPGGIHWYAKIDNVDIVDKYGNQKWHTKEKAKKVAEEFIKENS